MAKTIKTGILYRTAEFNRAEINDEKRTVPLTFSSESPVERYFGVEILDHDPASVDLSRLNAGGAILVDHNTRDQVGVVEPGSANIRSDKKGMAVARFGKSARANEIYQDVKDGIRSLVSVGYRIDKMVTEKVEKGVETMRATRWTPMEISLVSIPADTTVGVGRGDSVDGVSFLTEVIEQNNDMRILLAPDSASGGTAVAAAPTSVVTQPPVNADRAELDAINDRLKGKVPGIEDLYARALINSWTPTKYREEAVKLLPEPAAIRTIQPLEGVKPKDWQKYSLSRALNQLATNSPLDGFEREVSDEVAIKQRAKAQGFWVPPEVFVGNMARSFVAGTGTLGGNIVQTSNLGDMFIEVLRNKAQVMRLGARSLVLDNPVTIPRQNAAGSANWVGETVAATLSVGNFNQVTLTPNGLSAFQQYGKQLLATNNPSIDALIRDDINQILGLAIDLAALHGTGSGQPTGIAGTTGIGTVTLATDGLALNNATAYPALVSLETKVSTANADSGALAYLARPSHRGSLRTQTRFASTDTPVWTTMGDGSGDSMVNGYRAAVTNQIATNLTTGTATTICSAIFFGNWNEVLFGSFNGGATDLVVDPYTLAVNGVVRIIARHWCDIAFRHPASFAVLGGILP